ncbi:MAG TPA: bifunctional DNA-binding transcriptional regulator/O6-methylguanine-DNA methyltransferase Ada [Steroidobacteraceae bacterium]|nr:bifunctional DNA-binding transcriptional regulator/O6-methylguanine-DNA methyltransferase Ada [Steroidobacteraceae bacterium]
MNDAARWAAVEQRDAAFDGEFVFAVRTTGIYCKPSCASRRALRKNVIFFDSAEAAVREGFRACQRCRPNANSKPVITSVVHELARAIDANPHQAVRLESLAKKAGYSPFHLQRAFKSIIGSTPKQYQNALRVRVLKRALHQDASVTDAIYTAGFGSSSRIYEQSEAQLGMTPREYRSGGKGLVISHAHGETPLGLMLIGATDRGICFLQFGDSEAQLVGELQRQFPAAAIQPMPDDSREEFERWMAALNRHLQGLQPTLDLPLDLRGTAFQLIVWRYLQHLPYGEVKSYAEVARDLGKPSAARAVARACASNRVALLVPCHRVLRGTGALGGYRWGLERKRVLLDTERTYKDRTKTPDRA